MRDGAPAEVVPLAVDVKSRQGSAVVPNVSRCKAVALVVANLSDGTYGANNPSAKHDGDYTYSLSLTDMPTLASLDPDSLPQGAVSQSIRVAGTHFTDGSKLAATFSGTGVTVESITFFDDLTLSLTTSVDDAAALGARDLTLTTGSGVPVSLPQALLVTEKPAAPDAGAEPAGADASLPAGPDAGSATNPHPTSHTGCSQAGAGLELSLAAGLAMFLAALRRRAR